MNVIFAIIVVVGLLALCITQPQSIIGFLLQGTEQAVSLTIKLAAIYALWMGVLKIAEESGVDKWLAKLFKPLLGRMFKDESEQARTLIGLNMTANLLGMGGAATPLGIKAIESMSKGEDYATDNMILFLILNVTSVQLVPGTIVALRQASGSANAADIVLPSLVSTLITAVLSVSVTLIIRAVRRKKRHAVG